MNFIENQSVLNTTVTDDDEWWCIMIKLNVKLQNKEVGYFEKSAKILRSQKSKQSLFMHRIHTVLHINRVFWNTYVEENTFK